MYSTRYVREMLNGEIPMRKCRKCGGRGEEHWLEIHDLVTGAVTFKDSDGPVEVPSDTETHEYYAGATDCGSCDGLGWVQE